jgi:hypothetical protein
MLPTCFAHPMCGNFRLICVSYEPDGDGGEPSADLRTVVRERDELRAELECCQNESKLLITSLRQVGG